MYRCIQALVGCMTFNLSLKSSQKTSDHEIRVEEWYMWWPSSKSGIVGKSPCLTLVCKSTKKASLTKLNIIIIQHNVTLQGIKWFCSFTCVFFLFQLSARRSWCALRASIVEHWPSVVMPTTNLTWPRGPGRSAGKPS